MVGLGSVNNTSDAAKPVSTATQTALDAKQATSEKGAANGYAGLDALGLVPVAQLPGIPAAWGAITGTLSAQTDLQSALDAKLATNGSAAALTSFPTLNQNTTGSAATLTTPRTINGTSFNGSANITLGTASVTLAQMADMATASLIYRKTAATGVPEVNTLATLKTDLGLTGTNSGDQTSIVGITGTIAQFNTACTDADFATGGGTATGTNTGDQTSVSGNAGTVTTNANLTGHVTSIGNAAVLGSFTVAQLNTALSDGDVATGGGTATGDNTGDNATNTQYSGLAASKQDTLVSATNIKTINGSTVLGSGDLVVAGAAPAFTAFTKDLGVARSSGTFDITGLSGLTAEKLVSIVQSAAPIISKGNARDEAEFDLISVTGYVADATTIRGYWRAPGVVVGNYNFAYQVSG